MSDPTWNFDTEADAVPTVSTLYPRDSWSGVSIYTNLVLTFSEAVDVESGDVTIYNSDDSVFEAIDVTSGQVTGTGTIEIQVNPSSDLIEGNSYYVQVDATAFDDSGSNSYAGISDTTTWDFDAIHPGGCSPSATS